MSTRAANYTYRPPPKEYDGGWLATELQNISRSIPTSTIRKTTLSTTQLVTDRVVILKATSANLTFTLLAPTLAPVFPITVKIDITSTYRVQIIGTVDGVVSPTMGCAGTAWTLVPDPDGTQWVVI